MPLHNNKINTKQLFSRGDQLLAELGTLLSQLEKSRLSVRHKMDCALQSRSKKRSSPISSAHSPY